MSYAMLYDVPANEEMYRQVSKAIGDKKPEGLVVHLVLQAESGLRHIGVWDSQQDWQRFHDERLEPAVHAVLTAAGFTEMPPDPRVQEFKLVDVWIGA
jgi:hypothetical protein